MKYLLSIILIIFVGIGISSGCQIKGNIGFNTGEKIYHLPGCSSYNSTKINTNYGERWFCSEKDAINAGWRKAWNCSSYNSYTRPSITLTCGSNQCKFNGICYNKPSNASCVNSSTDARKCKSGYYESGNSCIKIVVEKTTKNSSLKCGEGEYFRHQPGNILQGRCVKISNNTSTSIEINTTQSSIYARKPISFEYRNVDKNKHCNHNRSGTSYNFESKMCLCPSGREFWEGYGCSNIKGGSVNSIVENGKNATSSNVSNRNDLYHTCRKNWGGTSETIGSCSCVVDKMKSINSNYDIVTEGLSSDKINLFVDKVYQIMCSS